MWWGTPYGGSMIYSNNAESLYTVRVNRVEPLYIPGSQSIFGTIRFDNFFGGPMFGHDNPKDPWILGNKISLHPTQNIEFGFSRTVVFAGKDYQPLTFGTFWKALACICDAYTAGAREFDVGDRRGQFDFRWRLPGLRKSLTIYADGIGDDDPSRLRTFAVPRGDRAFISRTYQEHPSLISALRLPTQTSRTRPASSTRITRTGMDIRSIKSSSPTGLGAKAQAIKHGSPTGSIPEKQSRVSIVTPNWTQHCGLAAARRLTSASSWSSAFHRMLNSTQKCNMNAG